MRALWWTGSFWPAIGGMEVFGARLLEGLVARGHTITVVTDTANDLPERDDLHGAPLHRLPFYEAARSRDPARIAHVQARARHLLRACDPDLVHLHSIAPATLFGLHALGDHRARMLVTKHELFAPAQPLGPETVVARMLARADAATCHSLAVLEDVCRAMPSIRDKCHVLHYGVPAPATPPAPPSFDPPRLLCVGRLVHQKGIDLAIAALAPIRARHPGATLVVAGEGPERSALEAEAARLGVASAVRFVGWVAPGGVPDLMRDASIVLVPSRHAEGFGLVAVEAGDATRPVVATRVPGLDEAVIDGETGRLVPPDDGRALADAVLELLADPARAAALGRRGRARARERCDLGRCIDRYDEIYRQLVPEVSDDRRSEVPALQR